MRLWSIHPRYLDRAGLLAVWREGLLAKKVLEGNTKGYKNHPQLLRFRLAHDPLRAINEYLYSIVEESKKRLYLFDANKISRSPICPSISVTRGQILYEWSHFLQKLQARDTARYNAYKDIELPEAHPLFTIVDGEIETWEKI